MISVIIPAYNATKTIQNCLNSVYNQTYKDLEVIVVDDGSEDDLVLALTNCQHMLTILHQDNKGAPAARNYGFSVCHGDYVIFLDADIILRADAIEKLLEALENSTDAAYAYCSFRWGWKKFKLFPYSYERLKKMPYIHTSALIRRKDFPGFDESLKKFQDWDLFLTIANHGGKGIFVSEVLMTMSGSGTMSSWLPSFVYKLPWPKLKSKDKYEKWEEIIKKKHNL